MKCIFAPCHGLLEYAGILGFGRILVRWQSNLWSFSATLRSGATEPDLQPFLMHLRTAFFRRIFWAHKKSGNFGSREVTRVSWDPPIPLLHPMTSSSDFIRSQLKKVYRENRLEAPTPTHKSQNNSQPSWHWLLFNMNIHNPHPTWFPHYLRKAMLALLLSSGFFRKKRVSSAEKIGIWHCGAIFFSQVPEKVHRPRSQSPQYFDVRNV